jgi:diadenosine tetraphosphate (Ap4A) HIT family hydrolase
VTETPTSNPCPFCTLPVHRIVAESRTGCVIRDAFPVSPGHTLVIPRRHIASFFDLAADERNGLMDLLEQSKVALDLEMRPDAYNIGINDGKDAGQTVAHLHIHLIPRYQGDQPDPRGGIRWLFPERARYWP